MTLAVLNIFLANIGLGALEVKFYYIAFLFTVKIIHMVHCFPTLCSHLLIWPTKISLKRFILKTFMMYSSLADQK
jgi:hypothetical protein